MATVFEIGLANAVVATLLGAGTFLVGRWLRRPAVIHVLWIVVLVKLITPPLFLLPLPSLRLAENPREVENGSTGPLSESRSQTGVPKPESGGLPVVAFEPNISGTSALEDFGAEPEDNPFQQPQDTPPNLKSAKLENEPVAATVPPTDIGRNGGTASLTESPRAMAGSSKTNPPQAWGPKLRSMALQGLSLVWIVGSLAFIGLMGFRIRRFRRLLGQAGLPAPEELCRELAGLARSMGLSRVPKLVLVPGTVSPLVWAVDLRPVIVFPQGLLERLDASGRRSLFLHELTHLRRRDHWVRGLELIVGCLYWWLPLVWLARRELQQAEEECCDAWVVWWMEGERRPYAKALLQTLDFLAGVPAEMPPAASGLGHVAFLRQRLKGILREDIPRSMGWREMLAIVLCSLMVLPVIPSWGQSGEEPPTGAVITPNAEAISNTPSEKESNPAPLSTAAIVAKQVDYRVVPMLDSIDFQPQSQAFPPVVQYAQGSVFSGDGRWLITVYGRPHETGEVRIWNVATHEEEAMWKEPIGMRSVAMAPDGKTFAYGTYGGVIQLGDIETGKRLTAWDAIPTGIESLSFSADGRWLVAGTSEGVVHVWEVATAKIAQTLKGHKGRVYAVGFLPDNATILSSGFDKTLRFWDRSSGHMIRSVEQPDQVFSLAVAPDGKRIATACQDGRVRLFDSTGEPQTTLTPPQGAVSVAFAPSGETLAVSHGGTVSLWNVNTGQSLAVIQANQEVDRVEAEQNTDSHLHNQESPSDQSSEPGQKPSGKIRDKPLPTEAAFLQIRNADGSRAVFNNVVKMTVGFPKPSPAIWMGSPSREGIVSLDGLPAGAHWLLAAGDSPGRLPFLVTIPTKQALLQQRLRSPEWWGKKVEFGRQPMVEVDAKVGEVIVVEIHNQSTEALRFSEADIVLVSQLEDELIRGLSPHWLTADREPFPETRIEAGQTGRLRLIWRDWARQGLWSSRNHEPITEPGFPPSEPGKVWVKAGLGFAGSLPVSVTDPNRKE